MAKLKCSIENSIKLKYLIIILYLYYCINFVNGYQQNEINILNNDVDILTENVLSQLEGRHQNNHQNVNEMADDHHDDTILLSNIGDDMNVIYNPTLPPTHNSQYTELSGGIIVGERILNKLESPYLLRTDLEIERGAKLRIGAGVNIQFAPMVGITIRGSIMAIGTPEEKITFTSQQSGGVIGGHTSNGIVFNPQEIGARLVDGPSPIAGRLQLFHHSKWRSVCTNSRNWTITDYEIACRQMGFQGGRFWNWMERLANYDPRLLYEEPNCNGREQNLRECLSWHNRQIGAGACDYHNDIGIQCLPVHDNVAAMTGHWRGLHFVNAPSESRLSMDNIVYEQHSLSELNHVDIVRAGIGRAGIVTAALDVFGQPPTVKHVTIDHSAYTGINVTKANSAFVFYNVTVRHSRGIGIFINSSYGLAHFEGCSIIENGADGIRYVGHDLRVDERIDRSQIFDFCTLPTTAGQTYPISVSLQQSAFAGSAKDCGQYFFTRPGYVITVSFMHFMVRMNETAKIEVYDGTSSSDRLLGTWMVRNFTRPQSLTSTREKVYIQFNANPRSEMLGFLRLTAGPFKAYDLNVTETLVLDNGGRGIAIDNLRSTLHVHTSDVSNNGHVAGVHVTSGAGDVNITRSKISFNQGDGINITYVGGNRNVSRSSISSNVGYGMAVWLNQTRQMDRLEFYEFNQTSVVEYSNIVKNLEIGILHGNFCGEYFVNITGNHFNNSIGNSIDIQSCWFDYCFARDNTNRNVNVNEQESMITSGFSHRRRQQINETLLKLQIGHNVFEYDNRIGIIISPAINVYGRIEYNHFRFGKYGSMLIRNKPWEEYRHLPVQLFIQNNQFYNNYGIYVVSIGLSPYVERDVQWLLFTRNFVRMNRIREPFEQGDETVGEGTMGENRLSPRSRVAAPIVISSSNVDVYRNIIQNIESKYEVGSQLSDQSQVLNVTYNWLGHSEESIIFQRLFHRKDRYDLAKIEYLPYLLHNSNPGANTIYYNSLYVPKFYMEGVNQIGGEVDGQEILPTGTYTVDRDINIRPGGTLMLQPGVILNFAPSVGMMVTGKLEARGRYPDDIFFTLKREPIMSTNDSVTEQLNMMDMENIDQETETINTKMINGIVRTNQEDGNGMPSFPSEQPMIPLRIIGGPNEHVGRLEIYLQEKWGTVCDYGWTIVDAALACHQMGLAMNPSNWRLLRSEVPNANTDDPILLSNVRCTEHDIDIRRCRAERLSDNEFEHSCTHENDVGIRCSEGAWAGLRFGVLAEQADLQYVTVEKAGLFDYSTNSFKPAIQMDFARHNLNNVRVVNNLHDGLGIIYSDIYGGGSINNVQNSEFSNNYGNGISLKQLGLKVHGSMIKENFGSGISHDSVLSDIEQRELAGWFHMASDFNVLESKYKPWILPRDNANIDIDTWQNHHILTTRYQGEESVERTINIRCRPGYVIGLQLLNPIQNGSTEDILIYDSQTGNLKSAVFQLKRDLNAFPMTSSSYGIQLYYNSGTDAIGGVVLIISTSPAPVQDIKNKIVRGPVPTLQVTRTSIQNNRRGISATYYNRHFGERGELYLRKSNESIKIIQSDISHNYQEAVFVYAPFWDVHLSNLSEITIHINSTLITNNGRGVRQFSRDLRSSNNLYHYVMQDTTIEANRQGGFEINLPFVWQYNENFTHSIYLGNVTWQRNKQFGLEINGHYAAVNITKNVFNENECYNGLIAFRGMEKKMKIDYNRMINNNGRYIVEFRSDSLSEILGEVSAVFTMNEINNNRFEHLSMHSKNGMMIIGGGGSGENIIDNSIAYHASGIARQHAQELRMSMLMMTGNERQQSYSNVKDPTCVIGFNGVQKVRVFRNLITKNAMNYDLIAGVKSARLKNFLDATENWWGSTDSEYILSRIFDFDDWNNYAEVMYQPYLLEDNFDSSMSVSFQERRPVDLERLGGRIFENLLLQRRETPYFVNADITVMPGVTLTIAAGVEMEFAPNVGILVLGTLIARGFQDGDIIMRVQKSRTEALTRRIEKRALENLIAYDTIRLCTERNCSLDDNELNPVHQGFLEYFNHTTLQWVPICDRRFTERNAQVVCRELGFDPLNVFIGHDKRIEYHTNSLTRIWSWVQPLECNGNELHFHECHERLNGQLYGHRHECHWNDNFVFVSCNSGDTNYNNVELNSHGGGAAVTGSIGEIKQYWGGIRFAYSDFEQQSYEHRYHDVNTHSAGVQDRSHIEFIRLENAGMLHNEKSPAIQSILKSPIISSITIRNSAHHGINLISPRDTIHIQHSTIHNTFGQGVYGISLTGEGRESEESSFQPLKSLELPYHLFSLIDICDTNKVITIEERVIIYYKYDYNPVNCVKIFNSAYRVKPIGFRLLQSNLFNHSKEYGRRDSIQLYDGDIYNITSKFIGQIESDSSNEKHLFKTRGPILSVRLIASGAPATYGFFAEVVTLPISAIGFNRDAQHNISNTEIRGAIGGAISYHSVGEVSPTLTMENNRIQYNCRQLYGNFSTCDSAIKIDVHNMQALHFRNNLIQQNQGGLFVRADSRGSATSLRGWISHNLFTNNTNRPALFVEGRQSSPYQEVTIFKNYITQNRAAYEDVIRLRQVVSNFTYNYVHSNRGGRILDISGFDKVRLPIYQTTSHNGFYDNVATDWRGRATIVAGTAGQNYVDNIFYNPDNDYEMITVNRSITVDLWKTKIVATHNYWNYNVTLAVSGRIRDRSDDPSLLEVQFMPFHMNNRTVLDGKCPPGWTLLLDTCYMYIGAPMSFYEAREFCRSDNASLPFIHGDNTALWMYLQRQMTHLRFPEKVWVQDINYLERCTSFIYRSVDVDPCDNKYGFICEIDPKVIIDPLSWQADIVAISVISSFVLVLILLILFGFCWCRKSRHRHVQRLERRNSIRQSLRSLNTIDANGSIRRRNYNMSKSTDTLTKSTTTDYKKMMSNGSIDSMDKSVLSSETSYDIYDTQNQPGGYSDMMIKTKPPPPLNDYQTATINKKPSSSAYHPQSESKVYGLPEYNSANVGGGGGAGGNGGGSGRNSGTNGFELSYRNEGYRDNSTTYTNSDTRNNSIITNINEDTPIIHQIDHDDNNSDYYGNSSTLPIRSKGENLAFLSELKHKLPEYELLPNQSPGHSSFLPAPPDPPYLINNNNNNNININSNKNSNNDSSNKNNNNNNNFNNKKSTTNKFKNEYDKPEIRRPPNVYQVQPPPPDIKRPDSYFAAMRTARDSAHPTSSSQNQGYNHPPQSQQQKPSQPIQQQQRPSSAIIPNPITSLSNNSPQIQNRPKTVYEAAEDNNNNNNNNSRSTAYSRSKSEALLETNFDEDMSPSNPLTIDSRSYSQPLETAM